MMYLIPCICMRSVRNFDVSSLMIIGHRDNAAARLPRITKGQFCPAVFRLTLNGREIKMNHQANNLGDLVRFARKQKNLSQEALAEKLNISKRTIIDIEKNTGNPKFDMLTALVRELDLPLYELFYPEMAEDSDVQNLIKKELLGCTQREMKIMLHMIKSLREVFDEE